MEKTYQSIRFLAGSTISDAVRELEAYHERGMLVSGEFNGVMLFSDVDTIDSAYLKITGKSKEQVEKKRKEEHERYEREEREHQEKIPALTKFWSEKGKEVLEKKHWDKWDEIVPIRLSDLYKGMEIKYSLEIIKVLNKKGGTLQEAKNLIDKQSHSGTSYSLVCAMVREFSERGEEFAKFVE